VAWRRGTEKRRQAWQRGSRRTSREEGGVEPREEEEAGTGGSTGLKVGDRPAPTCVTGSKGRDEPGESRAREEEEEEKGERGGSGFTEPRLLFAHFCFFLNSILPQNFNLL